jgi:ABC-type glutathione transport system ATPase component
MYLLSRDTKPWLEKVASSSAAVKGKESPASVTLSLRLPLLTYLIVARAIIKQPPVLILDEATSAIDVRTERIVQQALDRVSENRTTITIAHRLSTIKRADKIVVLRAGHVVEEGTHNSLLENPDGVYSGLVRAQQLEMGNDEYEEGIQQDEQEQINKEEEILEKQSQIAEVEKVRKEKGVIRSFGLLMFEQRHRWGLYSLAGLACASIGGV